MFNLLTSLRLHQAILLNSTGSPWSVRWFFVDRPLRRAESIDVQVTAEQLAKAMLPAGADTKQIKENPEDESEAVV
jgi:hypothetical protein